MRLRLRMIKMAAIGDFIDDYGVMVPIPEDDRKFPYELYRQRKDGTRVIKDVGEVKEIVEKKLRDLVEKKMGEFIITDHVVQRYKERVANDVDEEDAPGYVPRIPDDEEAKEMIEDEIAEGKLYYRIPGDKESKYVGYVSYYDSIYSIEVIGRRIYVRTMMTDKMVADGIKRKKRNEEPIKERVTDDWDENYNKSLDIQDMGTRRKWERNAAEVYNKIDYVINRVLNQRIRLKGYVTNKKREYDIKKLIFLDQYKVIDIAGIITYKFAHHSQELERFCKTILGGLWSEITKVSENIDHILENFIGSDHAVMEQGIQEHLVELISNFEELKVMLEEAKKILKEFSDKMDSDLNKINSETYPAPVTILQIQEVEETQVPQAQEENNQEVVDLREEEQSVVVNEETEENKKEGRLRRRMMMIR